MLTRRWSTAFVALAAAGISACGVLLGFDDILYTTKDASTATSDAEATEPDASPADAVAADASASDGSDASDGGPGCVNLFTDPGFEATAKCEPWSNNGGSLGLGGPPRSGAQACRACAEFGFLNMDPTIAQPNIGPGEVGHFEIFARAENSLLAGHPISVYARGGQPHVSVREYVLTEDYQRMIVDHAWLDDAGDAQPFVIHINVLDVDAAAGTPCVLFDDVTACVARDGG